MFILSRHTNRQNSFQNLLEFRIFWLSELLENSRFQHAVIASPRTVRHLFLSRRHFMRTALRHRFRLKFRLNLFKNSQFNYWEQIFVYFKNYLGALLHRKAQCLTFLRSLHFHRPNSWPGWECSSQTTGFSSASFFWLSLSGFCSEFRSSSMEKLLPSKMTGAKLCKKPLQIEKGQILWWRGGAVAEYLII